MSWHNSWQDTAREQIRRCSMRDGYVKQQIINQPIDELAQQLAGHRHRANTPLLHAGWLRKTTNPD
jgi:hypothetical protein